MEDENEDETTTTIDEVRRSRPRKAREGEKKTGPELQKKKEKNALASTKKKQCTAAAKDR